MNRRISLVVVTAVAGLALAGCSSASQPAADGGPAAPPAVSAAPAAFIAQAADSTAATGSAKLVSTTSIKGAPMGGSGTQDLTITADGVIDFAGSEASLQVSSPMMGSGSSMQVVLADGVGYVKVPMFGDKWISSPTKDLGLSMADPTKGLETLRKAADLTEVGTEDINGVTATKYTGTVDLSEAVGQLGLPAADAEKAQRELAKVARTADVTVWVDDQDRVVRYDQELAVNADGQQVQVSSSTSLSDFGITTDIQAPPADQVMDASKIKDMMPQGMGAGL